MAYNVKLEVFEGPFDLLVYLIEKAQMDIYDIRISEITSQYIDYIDMMQDLNLEVVSEFLVLAATLLEIKSKMLLPVKESNLITDNEEIDPRSLLVQKILEYKKYKNAAEVFKENHEENSKILYKVKEDIVSSYEDHVFIDLDLDQFVQAFNIFLEKKKKIFDIQKQYTEAEKEVISIEDKIAQIKNLFKQKKKIDFYNLIHDDCDRHEVILTFLAVLELLKQSFIKVQQHVIFGKIVIIKNIEGEKVS